MCGNRQPGRIINKECGCWVCECHKEQKTPGATECSTDDKTPTLAQDKLDN